MLIPTVLVVSMLSFVLIQLPPGDLLTIMMNRMQESGNRVDADIIERFTTLYHLDEPLYVQYGAWISGIVLRGDFGYSVLYRTDVADLVWGRLQASLLLILLSIVFAYGIGIPVGIFSAVNKYSVWDHLLTFFGFLGMAIPNFFLALILMYFAIVFLDVNSVSGFYSNAYMNAPWSFGKLVDLLKHLWIPVLVIGTSRTAGIIRIMRANLLDVLNEQYVTTAKSKGIRPRAVIYKHAVRNAINPLISIIGMDLPEFLTGAVVVSIVLNLPTAGDLLYQALINQDMQLGGAILLLVSLVLVVGNLLADIALGLADPRVRYA